MSLNITATRGVLSSLDLRSLPWLIKVRKQTVLLHVGFLMLSQGLIETTSEPCFGRDTLKRRFKSRNPEHATKLATAKFR